MKKVFKIAIPIILAIALIGCSVWYLFIYDRDFTQDMLLKAARFFDEKGSNTAAQWMYGWAYDFGKDNDAVAIELANQYKEAGNYAKAEYTLHKAIQNSGGSSLYVALSKTYVEQGKLQDALKLIDNAPESIRQELEPLHPPVPTSNRPDERLNDYGPISITAEGKLYVNADGQIPSVKRDLYTGPITLHAGENIIRAIVVAPNGLCRQQTFKYTVHGVIEPVTFADPAFEAEIRTILQIPEETIYTNQLWEISSFTMPETVVDYTDLQYLLYLQKLTIHNGVKGQLSILATRTGLLELDLTGTPLTATDVETIGKLTNLTKLVLNNCSIASVTPFTNLTKVTHLDLQKNTLKDISAISGMTGLTELYLNNNAVNDLSVIKNFPELTKLNVANNDLSNIEPVFGLTNLTWLDASTQGQDENGGITSIAGIKNLTKLVYLGLAHNKLTDISELSYCTELNHLDISSNNISSISALKDHMRLMFLYFSHNSVKELPAWDKECMLVTVDGSYNLLTSVEPLADLHALNNVLVNYNEGISSVDCLVTCHALILVEADGTNVKEADALLYYYPEDGSEPQPTGIKVKFDPTKEGKN